MKKILLIAGLVMAVVVAGVVTVLYTTKSHSPSSQATYESGDLKVTVSYHSPFKKGRKIFDGLVPYGKTWRTGANEPTVFETNKTLMINGKLLKAGRYSLWTVPNKETWEVIFNSSVPAWGINVLDRSKAARNTETDALVVTVPVMITVKEFEKFTISIDQADDMLELVLAWDRTLVAIPFSVSE